MISFFNYFVKFTGWIAYAIVFRTKVYYEDKSVQSRHFKGPAILMSNHTSVYDYMCALFVFFFRTLRYQMAEVLYKKKLLGLFLKMMGGIYVNRDTHDLSFIDKSKEILDKGGVVGTFPESRIPKKDEERPLPFKPSVVLLALQSDKKIVPFYTDGNYFTKKRNRVMIGKPIDLKEMYDENKSEKQNIEDLTLFLRQKVIYLGELLNENK